MKTQRHRRNKKKTRKRRNVYLGKRVKDTGKEGLDNLREVEDICKAILADFKRGRIPYATAMRRLVFLRTTVIKRSEKLVGKKRKAYKIVKKYERKLEGLKNERS